MRKLSLILLLTGCGRDASETDYKMAGVGLNPEEIAPEPKMYGGLISYDFIEFNGAALPLGLVGLVSFTGVGPELGTFEPPYSMVYGSAFFFEGETPVPDALFGSFAVAPEKVGKCQTVYEPRSYLSGIADAGTAVNMFTADGEGFALGRRPLFYPPDVSQVFPYYLDLSVHREYPREWRQPTGDIDFNTWEKTIASYSNFPFGKDVEVSFPGAIAPESATFGTIPVPYYSSLEDKYHTLPTRPIGVKLMWDGPMYSGDGVVLQDSGLQETCMHFSPANATNRAVTDCLSLPVLQEPVEDQYERGQMYTGPWDTADGKVTIQWIPNPNSADETVSISVRFLGPVDETDSSLVEEVVKVGKTPQADEAWERGIRNNEIPEGTECPETGYRSALPCDEDIDFVFDEQYRKGDGYVSTLQGNPTKNLAEVTCHVNDSDGVFEISEEILADAMAYGKQHGAKGAIFYINRNTKTELNVPDVRDRVGNRRVAGPILVSSNAVQIGRFWFVDGALD